jgi:hypothetical protein
MEGHAHKNSGNDILVRIEFDKRKFGIVAISGVFFEIGSLA